MITIFKYDLPQAGTAQLEMPKDSIILDVGLQKVVRAKSNGYSQDQGVFWVKVDTSQPMEVRTFTSMQTGQKDNPFLNNEDVACKYIGTLQYEAGADVRHIFEVLTIPQALKAANEFLSKISPSR